MGKSRKGRGRLSTIDMLPAEADEAVAWALEALRERKLTQTEILLQFNARLAALEPPVDPVSKSAFNRWSLRFAQQARRVEEARQAAAALAERLDDLPEGDVGLMLGETIKALINDVLLDEMVDGGSPSMKMLNAAADSLYRLERARRDNVETAKIARDRFVEKAAEAAETVAREKGLTADTVRAIKAEILGVS